MGKINVCLIFVAIFAFLIVKGATFTHHHRLGEDKIGIYELKKGNFSLKFTNLGATTISVVLPDRSGKLADVILGFDSAESYLNNTPYFGATLGRVANRIAGAQFTLNGTTYKLLANDGKNMLHGGPKGFSKVIWKVKTYKQNGNFPHIAFTYKSSDGDQGFPGKLQVTVSYTIFGKNMLSVQMRAKAINKATPVNLAQHFYWNLGGHNSGNILSNTVQIFASQFTPVDTNLIPTGKFSPVKGTPYDFLYPHKVGSLINKLPNGYDINYVIDDPSNRLALKKTAVVYESKSGRVMELWTNAPGVQFYTSNGLKDVKGKGGFVYGNHAALCLETQGFPDSVNHPSFPSQIVNPGQTYRHHMVFRFSTK